MITVYIVEDHSVVVEGIISLLHNEANIKVVGHSTTSEECLQFFKTHTCNVVLMDINLPDSSGIDLCKQIKEQYKNVMVLALSTFNQGSYMSKMMESGASGYLLKNVNKEELIAAINTANEGGIYFSFETGKIYKSTLLKQSEKPILTKREIEVLKLIAQGLTNNQISTQLFISIDTVDTHRKNLYFKLNVKNTALLIRAGIDNEIL